jgi:hypothetical protein
MTVSRKLFTKEVSDSLLKFCSQMPREPFWADILCLQMRKRDDLLRGQQEFAV